MKFYPFDFDISKVQGFPLKEVRGNNISKMDDGGFSFENVVFSFENFYILLSVDSSTDEIVLKVTNDSFEYDEFEWVNIDFLKKYFGSPMGWAWIGTNFLGYRDVVMFSFSVSGMTPDVVMLGEASDIRIYCIQD